MITQTAATWQTPAQIETLPLNEERSWKQELSGAITRADELLSLLDLADSPLARSVTAMPDFPLRVPLPYVQRMEKGNPDDPLLRQVLPVSQELVVAPGFNSDPLEEAQYNPVPGIVHKYSGRVLLITSPACAVHCRYCFRRHFPYEDNTLGKSQWQQALDYIAGNSSIREVILSGGDPLAANDNHLHWLVDQLAAIKHVQRLRVHTRFPVVIPSRIDADCLAWLTATRLTTVVVLHINHANEIDDDVAAMIQRLRGSGITVLNQAVLLKDVNDEVQTLTALSERLFENGVLPYYLHLLDPVSGASHFDIANPQAMALYRDLQAQLPGYLVPRLVRDTPGAAAKTLAF
ncbi:MAG: lysine 2,3-aminomutase [Gammaproteobacteria bacterium BRH_c0]|nr:MAG: lysine 2,3-aminomutase [Gammaproteobacteria bacterium BRH_c0]